MLKLRFDWYIRSRLAPSIDISNLRVFLKVPAKKKSELFVPQYDERERYDNHDLVFFSETFTFCLFSANLVKVFKCFTMLDRSMGSSPLGGTLNFSLWIAEVLALELVTFTVPELASLFAISSLLLARFCMLPPPPTLISFLIVLEKTLLSPYLSPSPYLLFFFC